MRLISGDCIEAMRDLAEASVDAVVTDPPYGINFMGKAWDGKAIAEAAKKAPSDHTKSRERSASMHAGSYDLSPSANQAFQLWCQQWAEECLRVLKPGGHLLSFSGSRTYHRLACAVEDAGFEVRDQMMWLYGSGFPKSLDVSKAIDRRPGATEHAAFAAHLAARREAKGLSRAEVSELVVGTPTGSCWNWEHFCYPEARYWTALRDLLDLDESWARFIEGAEREVIGSRTVNGEKGTAGGYADGIASQRGLDVSGSREVDVTAPATSPAKAWEGWGTALKPAHEPIVVARKPLVGTVAENVLRFGTGALNIDGCRIGTPESKRAAGSRTYAAGKLAGGMNGDGRLQDAPHDGLGRWPANVVLDEEAGRLLDEQSGEGKDGVAVQRNLPESGSQSGHVRVKAPTQRATDVGYGGSGGASRFFYCAKASKGERNAGLDELPVRITNEATPPGTKGSHSPRAGANRTSAAANHHPTVKPISLMRYLVRLVTPPEGTVLDPFLGSGTTGCAAVLEGFDFIGIEREAEYLAIAQARIEWWEKHRGDGATEEILKAAGVRDEIEAGGQLGLLEDAA